MAGVAVPFAVQGMAARGVAARPRPGQQLPAGASLTHRGGHPESRDGQSRQRDDQATARPGGRHDQRPAAGRGRRG